MGGVHPPLRFFLFLTSFFKIWKRFFASVIKIISGICGYKFFIFQMSGRWFPWHPKGGGVHPPINLEVFFTHILATATRLNTLYGLETLHSQLSRHVGITQKVSRYIRHFWRIYDVINAKFFFTLQFLATASIMKFVESLNFHIKQDKYTMDPG